MRTALFSRLSCTRDRRG